MYNNDYNNRRRNGYYNNRGPYDGYGYNNGGGGYRPQQDPYQQQNFPFDIGQVVIHKATGTELTVIRFGREQLECRLPDLTSQWFYIHELEARDLSSK